MKWPSRQDPLRLGRLAPLFMSTFLAGSLSPAAPVRNVQPIPDDNRDSKRKLQPAPTPFIQREEVRFVTLDLLVEQRGGPGDKGWHPARNLTKEEVHVFVGSEES